MAVKIHFKLVNIFANVFFFIIFYLFSNSLKILCDDPVVEGLLAGLMAGDRASLARAITLAETVHPIKKAQAQTLLAEVLKVNNAKANHSVNSTKTFRIGMIQ